MDELELLKKDWKANSTQIDQQLSCSDIYPMLHKKSSSIVKTLFYISIAELLFWIVANVYPLFSSKEYREELVAMFGNRTFLIGITIFSILVILVFVYLLFKSYKSISVADSAKKLMENILKTRKIIKYYVIYNLVMAFLSLSIGLFYTINFNPEVVEQFAQYSSKQMFMVTITIILGIAFFLLLFWIFYRIIYGVLLKRLNRNYKELKRLEV
jgi:flagellar biogenesis protein FliO